MISNLGLIPLGARIVEVTKPQSLLDILENEIDYLEHCVDNPFGKSSLDFYFQPATNFIKHN